MKEDWIECNLEDLVTEKGLFSDGDWVEKKDQDQNGEVRLIQLADIGDGNFRNKSKKFLTLKRAKEMNCSFLAQGDILIARMPEPLGRCAFFPFDKNEKFITAVDVAILRPKNRAIDNKFLLYQINSPIIRNEIDKLKSGTTRKRISRKNLNKIDFKFPSLVEQQAIVNKIEALFSSLDSGIADLKKAQDQLKIYRQSVLKKAFEGELTSTKTINEPLEPLTELITKGASPKWQGFDYTNDNNELLFITSENVREGFISLEKEKYLPKGFNEIQKRSILQNGDVLLNIVGASIGRAAIFELDKLSNINQAVCLIRLKEKKLLKKYLCYYLNSETAKQDYLNKQVDVARANLSLTNVKELEVPYCTPKEQHQIVQEIESRLSVCDAVEQNIAESLEKAQALRQSILKKAFEGKLLSEEEIATCKAHPDYEPASVLLERIKTSRKRK